ncbi:MAG: cupin domain-containing protein [Chitinophagaceae bacterium]|nr:cupin domain-containing protein [Chitinophagaceae bacterium]
MATKGHSISNSKTGERITWIETAGDSNGKRLVFDFTVSPNGKLPVTHFHPNQAETFEVKSGEFTIKLGKETRQLKAGDKLTIDKGIPHQWWNPSATVPAAMVVTFEPALNTETFLEQFFGLGNDNKTKPDGTPSFLQIMAMVNEYEIYVAGPPLPIQRAMGFLIGGIARVLGYKKYYRQYSEGCAVARNK